MLSGHGERAEQGTKTSDKENQQQTQKTEITHSQACLGLSLAHLLPPEETQQALPPLWHTAFQQKQGPPQERGTKGLIPEQNTCGGVYSAGLPITTFYLHNVQRKGRDLRNTAVIFITNIKLIPSQKKKSTGINHNRYCIWVINKTKTSVNAQTEIQRPKTLGSNCKPFRLLH